MKKPFTLLLSLGLAVGCGADTPTDPHGLSPDFKLAGNSGCAAVKFTVVGVFDFVNPVPIVGDLEGTFFPTFIGDTKFTGATQANGGTAVWDITGGVLGPLTFETTFDNRNIDTDRPGSPATVFENTGSHRALNGVAKANLTYHGPAIFDPVNVTFVLEHDYNGVICP